LCESRLCSRDCFTIVHVLQFCRRYVTDCLGEQTMGRGRRILVGPPGSGKILVFT